MEDKLKTWSGELIDAYAHIGNPKYGSVDNLEIFFERLGIERGVLVLGPGLPDLTSLIKAKEKFGDKIRFMGIPFGETREQRMELGELQIKMGIRGMRLMPFELEPNRQLIDRLGEEGLWLFAINPYSSKEATQFLIDWLERHPKGRVASPHFLTPKTINQKVEDGELFRKLLKHERFHAILSRHGGVESLEMYPHKDLLPWVEELVKLVTWKRLMWGGEFPIFYQRNEQPEMVRDWILNLGIEISEQEKKDFYRNNTLRLIFEEDAQVPTNISIPEWVEKQLDVNSKVNLLPTTPLNLPMDDFGVLLSDYLEKSRTHPNSDFSSYLTEKLSESAEKVRSAKKT